MMVAGYNIQMLLKPNFFLCFCQQYYKRATYLNVGLGIIWRYIVKRKTYKCNEYNVNVYPIYIYHGLLICGRIDKTMRAMYHT